MIMSLIINMKTVLLVFIVGGFVFVSCKGQTDTSSSIAIAPMEKSEQEALYLAIQGFVGNWWNGSDLYPDPCGWTPIEGVSCDLFDGSWYVSALNFGSISDNSLQCAQKNAHFSWHHLFELKHLTTLSFSNCFLSPTKNPVRIPTSGWEKLSNTLHSLEFRSNPGLLGTIPTTIGNLTALESLLLLGNGLTGELPTSIGNLVNLKRLVLAGNRLVGQIPASFGRLDKLLILDSSRNYLSGSLPWSIGGWTSLLKLDLNNNSLQGELPREMGYLKNLTLLDLGNNNFSGGLVQELQEMASIETIVLSNNPLMGGDLMRIQWQNLQNMEILDLSNMGATGNIPESLAEVKRLRFLGLDNNKLSGTISPRLATLPNITAFYINGNNFTGELEFSEWFFKKMGRRFGAWSNPNLCYSEELFSNGRNVPFGVKSCQQGINATGDGNSIPIRRDGNLLLNQNSHFVASFGCSRFGGDGVLWVSLGKLIVVLVLVWDMLL